MNKPFGIPAPSHYMFNAGAVDGTSMHGTNAANAPSIHAITDDMQKHISDLTERLYGIKARLIGSDLEQVDRATRPLPNSVLERLSDISRDLADLNMLVSRIEQFV